MFNMNEVGRRISKLRKEKNLTQVELADKLGISYQAVSNWERGDSMPDIAKLADLSVIFDVSIDELLGNERSAKIIKDIIKEETIDLNDVSEKELKALLPIVKPEQFEKSFHNFFNISFEKLIIMAPFMETEDIDKIVLEKYKDEEISLLWVGIMPFVSNHVADQIFESKAFGGKWLASLAPFASFEKIDQKALNLYLEKGLKAMIVLLPFMSKKVVIEIYEKELTKGNLGDLMILMPFVGENVFKGFKG